MACCLTVDRDISSCDSTNWRANPSDTIEERNVSSCNCSSALGEVLTYHAKQYDSGLARSQDCLS